MRIKRIEIIGFKSFCDRSVIHIDNPVTSIVGPNGCGKSNIVDAIRWCMGEQSAKHLRGKAMDDVIFAGSESRGPASMAEVSLTFEDVGFSHETLKLAMDTAAEMAVDDFGDNESDGDAPGAPAPAEGGSDATTTIATGPDEVVASAVSESVEQATPIATSEVTEEGSEPAVNEAPDERGTAHETSDASPTEASTMTVEAASDEVEASLGDTSAAADEAAATEAAAATIETAVAADSSEVTAGDDGADAPGATAEGEAGDPTEAAPSVAREVEQFLEERPPAFDFARYSEVTITRRLFRDGTSNYMINKTPCRLRDVTDFFLGTGIGTKAYSIIEQGRIGMIVSSRPQDRRTIIEEAAGITKFKAKKRAAERKLDQTRQNLLRVSDIVAELAKRLGSLKRQAQKAERYRRYKAEVRDIELWKAAHKYLETVADDKITSSLLTTSREQISDTRTELDAREAATVAERAELVVEERRLSSLQEEIFEFENRIKLSESKIEFHTREAEELDGRVTTWRAEVTTLQGRRDEGVAELEVQRRELEELTRRIQSEDDGVAAAEAQVGEARQMLANAQSQLDDARNQLSAARSDLIRAEGKKEASERRREEAARRLERIAEDADAMAKHVEGLERETRGLERQLASLKQTHLNLGSQVESLAARRDELEKSVERGEAEIETLRGELHLRGSRLQSLVEIHEKYEGFANGTRVVMQESSSLSQPGQEIRGLVADVIEAPAELEAAVEAVLGDRLGGVVVSSPAAGMRAIEYLKQTTSGRSTFVASDRVPSPSLRPRSLDPERANHLDPERASSIDPDRANHIVEVIRDATEVIRDVTDRIRVVTDVPDVTTDVPDVTTDVPDVTTDVPGEAVGEGAPDIEASAADDPAIGRERSDEGHAEHHAEHPAEHHSAPVAGSSCDPATPRPGVHGRLADLVTLASGFEALGPALLGECVVVEDLELAMDLQRSGWTMTLVTLDGDLVEPSGVISGGSRDGQQASILSQKREIRELETLTAELEQNLTDATARFVSSKTELGQISRTIESLRKESHEGEIAITAHQKDVARSRNERERARARLNQLSSDRIELQSRIESADAELTEAVALLKSSTERIAHYEREQLGLIEGVMTGRERVEELGQRLTEVKVRAAQMGEKRAATQAHVLGLEATDRELNERIARLETQVTEAIERAGGLRSESQELAEALVGYRDQRRALAEKLEQGRSAYEHRIADLEVAEARARELRSTSERLGREANNLELKLGNLRANLDALVESVLDRHGVEIAKNLTDYHLRSQITDVEEKRLSELRRLITRMGSDINLTAIDEYADVSERHEFLDSQQKDLHDAVSQLEKAIAKINRTSRKLFRDTYNAVNQQFQDLFPRLFRGGQARLKLVAPRGHEGELDILDAGVEVVAQPPGKKNTTVDQLSGGEKALTAVALIFSIFLIKPSPFCLLDEVDAPLDEANVDRYNELVRQLTDRSQFIVITHNKRTMEIADSLYGVTMQEPGVSKLVSVNLRKLEDRAAA